MLIITHPDFAVWIWCLVGPELDIQGLTMVYTMAPGTEQFIFKAIEKKRTSDSLFGWVIPNHQVTISPRFLGEGFPLSAFFGLLVYRRVWPLDFWVWPI